MRKVDLPTADVERVVAEMVSCFDVEAKDILQVSAKTGLGMETILPAVIARIPPPPEPAAPRDDAAPTRVRAPGVEFGCSCMRPMACRQQRGVEAVGEG